MPGISFAYEDFCRLFGKKLKKDEFEHLLTFAKAELDDFLEEEVGVDLNDTNQPYLWSVEGLARLLRGVADIETGLAKTPVRKGKKEVIVDRKLSKVRPFIACFTAKGPAIDDYALKQLIQLQEKLCENFGRRRRKISIGIYPSRKIDFPVRFKAVSPDVEFVPLEFAEPMPISRILAEHPKGVEYGCTLEGSDVYPVLMDSSDAVLSLAPIINSAETGRVTEGDTELFFDCTGMDEPSVDLAANIFALALIDRGFEIESMTVKYSSRSAVTPSFRTTKIKFDKGLAERVSGLELKESDVKRLLERMRYGYSKGVVTVPSYRHDVMHVLDVVEDLIISYDFARLESLPLELPTVGSLLPKRRFIDLHRQLWTGLQYQEVFSPILSSGDLLYGRMCVDDFGTVSIKNFMSKSYSCVRSWLLPVLMDVLSKNKHVDYPQRLFEQGLVSRWHKDTIVDEEHLAAVCAHTSASYTELRQHVESVLRAQGVECQFEEFEWDCFIPGRAARVLVGKKELGVIGDLHPAVLEKFNLLVPVVGCELDLGVLG